ncbi:glycosyltransferase 61 family protein [Anabaena azotica]|uniref:glycosyltransferase 61 family protein n=1 Tax=Anabaena azotica TaxID=197653 RepID=UPI0039A47CC3
MDIHQLNNQANIFLQQANFSAAISIYEQCIELEPDIISLYWYLGLSWLLQGDEEKCHENWLSSFATTELEHQDAALTEFIDFLKNQAQEYLSVQKADIAQKIYEAILEWDDNQAEVYYNLGHAVAMQGNLEVAISYWETVVQIQPDWSDAHLHQAYIWQKLGYFNSAIENYQNAIALQKHYLTYYQLGLCYCHNKQWELAKDSFLNTIQIRSDYAPAYSDLAFVLFQQGDFEQGISYLQKAIEIKPELSQAVINMSQALISSSKNTMNDGIKFLKSLNALKYEPSKLYLFLHKILFNSYPEISLNLLQKILESEPQNIQAYLELSTLFIKQNQYLEAIAILEKIVDIYNHEQVYFNLGKCWLKFEDYQQAIVYLRRSIDINPDLTEAYYLLGIALFKIGNLNEAIVLFKQLLNLKFNSPFTSAYLGFTLANNYQFEDAIFYFKKAMESNSYVTPFVDELLFNIVQKEKLNQKFDFSQIQLVSPPRDFYESSQEWAENNLLYTDNYVQIYPDNDVKLTCPKSLHNDLHFSFRFGNLVKLPASYVVKIPQGRFWLSSDQTQSAILTDESCFLADISPHFPILSPNHPDKHPSQHPILSIKKLPPINFVEGKVAVLAGLTNHIYFHWMLDVLPRWELLRIINYDFSEIDYFVVDNRLAFQQETLRKLEIPANKQINICQIQHLQATELIVPSFPGCVAWMPVWTCEFLKRKFLNREYLKITSSKKRIYITRRLAKSRRLLNEEEILNFLQLYGFESVILESMSVEEQAVLFSQAEMIISPHGSGLTNLVFCQPGTKVIELFSPNYVYHCYWWISNLVGLDYYYLIGETLPGWYLHHLIYPQEFSEDILININDISKIMQLANI